MTSTTTIKPNGDGTNASWSSTEGTLYEAIDEGIGSTDDGSTYISATAETSCYLELESTPGGFVDAVGVSIDLRCQRSSDKGDAKVFRLQIFESDETTAISNEVTFTPVVGFSTVTQSLTITGTNDKTTWDAARVRIRTEGADGEGQVSTLDVVLEYDPGKPATPILGRMREKNVTGARFVPRRVDTRIFERTMPPPSGEAEPNVVPFFRSRQLHALYSRRFVETRFPTLVPLRGPLPPTGEEPGESTAPLLNQARRNDAMRWADAHFARQRRQTAQLLTTMVNPPLPPPPPTPAPTAALGSGPFMGGHLIRRVYWLSQTALRVEFSSSYGTNYHYQLYAGRCLIGTTSTPAQRVIVGHLQPAAWPPHLTLLAVDKDKRQTDYGDTLPPRPYNRVKLQFTASSWPADSKYIDVTGSATPGGAVVDSNLIERVLYDTDRQYTVLTKPLPGTGTWSFEVFGRDDRLANGNAGDVLELSQAVLAHPPDVALGSDGSRLAVSVASQTATITFTYP